jgi:HTH-type transcriptional regulator, competence development regulator
VPAAQKEKWMEPGNNRKENNPQEGMTLGEYLTMLRLKTGMSLREVEERTEKEVSNAYLSQLEKGRVTKPSPSILHALSVVYEVPYEHLMQRAGYLPNTRSGQSGRRQARVPTFAIKNITPDEEQALIDYLAYLRFKRKRA